MMLVKPTKTKMLSTYATFLFLSIFSVSHALDRINFVSCDDVQASYQMAACCDPNTNRSTDVTDLVKVSALPARRPFHTYGLDKNKINARGIELGNPTSVVLKFTSQFYNDLAYTEEEWLVNVPSDDSKSYPVLLKDEWGNIHHNLIVGAMSQPGFLDPFQGTAMENGAIVVSRVSALLYARVWTKNFTDMLLYELLPLVKNEYKNALIDRDNVIWVSHSGGAVEGIKAAITMPQVASMYLSLSPQVVDLTTAWANVGAPTGQPVHIVTNDRTNSLTGTRAQRDTERLVGTSVYETELQRLGFEVTTVNAGGNVAASTEAYRMTVFEEGTDYRGHSNAAVFDYLQEMLCILYHKAFVSPPVRFIDSTDHTFYELTVENQIVGTDKYLLITWQNLARDVYGWNYIINGTTINTEVDAHVYNPYAPWEHTTFLSVSQDWAGYDVEVRAVTQDGNILATASLSIPASAAVVDYQFSQVLIDTLEAYVVVFDSFHINNSLVAGQRFTPVDFIQLYGIFNIPSMPVAASFGYLDVA